LVGSTGNLRPNFCVQDDQGYRHHDEFSGLHFESPASKMFVIVQVMQICPRECQIGTEKSRAFFGIFPASQRSIHLVSALGESVCDHGSAF
jgi:hypothetical protein